MIGVDDRVEYTRTESRYDISDFSSHTPDSKDDQTFQNDLLHTVFNHCAKGVSSIPQLYQTIKQSTTVPESFFQTPAMLANRFDS